MNPACNTAAGAAGFGTAPVLEPCTIADYRERRAPVRAAFIGELTPRSPRASFQNLRQGKLFLSLTESLTDQGRHPVNQSDREGPPFDDRLAVWIEALFPHLRTQRFQDAEVEEQSAVAVLGQSSQSIESSHRHACLFQRLEHGIREPLGQLVKRHEAVSRD